MKKAVPFLLLTCVGLGLCASSLILSSHLSATSKVITLISSSCVFSSVALMVLVWALQGTWSITPRQDSLNRLATLAKKEKEILAGLETPTTTSNNDSLSADYSEDHGLWCDGFCCMHNPKNLYYRKENHHV